MSAVTLRHTEDGCESASSGSGLAAQYPDGLGLVMVALARDADLDTVMIGRKERDHIGGARAPARAGCCFTSASVQRNSHLVAPG